MMRERPSFSLALMAKVQMEDGIETRRFNKGYRHATKDICAKPLSLGTFPHSAFRAAAAPH
jgi:hypothetical protein